jgi:hypothetical protein
MRNPIRHGRMFLPFLARRKLCRSANTWCTYGDATGVEVSCLVSVYAEHFGLCGVPRPKKVMRHRPKWSERMSLERKSSWASRPMTALEGVIRCCLLRLGYGICQWVWTYPAGDRAGRYTA